MRALRASGLGPNGALWEGLNPGKNEADPKHVNNSVLASLCNGCYLPSPTASSLKARMKRRAHMDVSGLEGRGIIIPCSR